VSLMQMFSEGNLKFTVALAEYRQIQLWWFCDQMIRASSAKTTGSWCLGSASKLSSQWGPGGGFE
jgi:hypothetical protein